MSNIERLVAELAQALEAEADRSDRLRMSMKITRGMELGEARRQGGNEVKRDIAKRLRAILPEVPIGHCGKCGKQCRYVTGGTRSIWVHADTGNYLSPVPEHHDCNTHVVRINEGV